MSFQNGYSWRCTFATMKDNKVWFDFNLILVLGNEVFLYLVIHSPLVHRYGELRYPHYLHDGTLISRPWYSLPLKIFLILVMKYLFYFQQSNSIPNSVPSKEPGSNEGPSVFQHQFLLLYILGSQHCVPALTQT